MSGKWYYFFRKSIWYYLLATLIFGVVLPLDAYNGITSFLIYFFGLLLIVIPLMIMAAKIQGAKMEFDADITFSEETITIKHHNKELVETKDWNWIKNIIDKKHSFYFVINTQKRFGIAIAKGELKPEEIEFFKKKKVHKR